MATTIDDQLITPEEAAARLGIEPSTLAGWRSRQRYNLPFVKVGTLVRYRASHIERFINERTVNGDQNID